MGRYPRALLRASRCCDATKRGKRKKTREASERSVATKRMWTGRKGKATVRRQQGEEQWQEKMERRPRRASHRQNRRRMAATKFSFGPWKDMAGAGAAQQYSPHARFNTTWAAATARKAMAPAFEMEAGGAQPKVTSYPGMMACSSHTRRTKDRHSPQPSQPEREGAEKEKMESFVSLVVQLACPTTMTVPEIAHTSQEDTVISKAKEALANRQRKHFFDGARTLDLEVFMEAGLQPRVYKIKESAALVVRQRVYLRCVICAH
ncbi:hypothetical protein NDU88_001917 [Pleurodeles waltl]|uniref:Uncharacterized protein n=1 Tax=Pleurodeles waltl TaxID=8319 RepID=A0AAV7U7R9_PLEWA|nr:hypothetical protein NDU88_001917 [Pleurodeles waltl]